MFESNRIAALIERREQGLVEGEQIGLEKGRREEKQEMACHMKADGIPLDKISQYTGLSLAEIEAL